MAQEVVSPISVEEPDGSLGPIREIDLDTARSFSNALWIDVRDETAWNLGHVEDAIHLPVLVRTPEIGAETREFLSSLSSARPLVVYCRSGVQSVSAARALRSAGFTDVASLRPGYRGYAEAGLPVETTTALTAAQQRRYHRHLLLPEVGSAGQERLLKARVLLLGAGGLGSPVALYLAAAGVGTLGIVDDDVVDESNLQRQVLHSTATLGKAKVDSAAERLLELNPDVRVSKFRERLTSANIDRILDHGWDIIVDGLDGFATRYLVNDASVWRGIPIVYGAIYRFDGQVSTFWPKKGPCYRCLFPSPPPPEDAPSCAEAGVLGVLPGVIGTLQATEVLKVLLKVGEPLVGRLLQYDSLAMTMRTFGLPRNPSCAVCGDAPSITEYIDYEGFCSGRR